MKFILASKSPRRKEILNKLNLKFRVIPSNVDESSIDTTINPIDYCMQLAELKSSNISLKYSNDTIIGADTIVVIKNKILNKPKNFSEAFNMLKKLSGNTHQVITGVSIQNKTLNIKLTFYDQTEVTFYKLTDIEITEYIKSYNPMDKSGSYGIQDGSAIFVKKIIGSYDNIVGFPISKFYHFLKKLKLDK
tara:strand:- start:50 stop:622 length:573 start_codon:yes stop_codon:yes gene_type:complete